MKKYNAIMAGLLLVQAAAACASEELNDKLLEKGVPEVVMKLSEWPDSSVVEEKQVASTNDIVSRATRDSNDWLSEVFNPAWRPQGDEEIVFLKKEFEGRDVVRIRWKVEGACVTVSQTRSVFVLNVTIPRDIQEQLRASDNIFVPSYSKNLIRMMLPKERKPDYPRLGSGRPENIADIATWILPKHSTITLSDGAVVCCRRLVSPELSSGKSWYTMSWFEVMGCWTDGVNLVLYFEKTRPPPVRINRLDYTRSDFAPSFDQGWFSCEEDK
jgi:hypothetical protein